MSNIIWRRPDGGVSITVVSELALAKMAWAAAALADAGANPATVAAAKTIKENIGLDVQGHAAVLQRRAAKDRAELAARNQSLGDSYDLWTPVATDKAAPTDRTFRDGWTWIGGKVDHDMPKCRDIHRNRLREIRAPKLAALDVEYMRALEASEQVKLTEIAAKKQALRDVTADPGIDAAVTSEELKAVMPEALR